MLDVANMSALFTAAMGEIDGAQSAKMPYRNATAACEDAFRPPANGFRKDTNALREYMNDLRKFSNGLRKRSNAFRELANGFRKLFKRLPQTKFY